MAGLIDPQQLLGQLAAAASGAGSGSGGGPLVGAPAPGGSGDSLLPAPLQNILKQILLSDVKSRFSTGTSPTGVKWRPLSHPRPNGGDVPLRDTGMLMASFSGGSDGRSVWVGTMHPGAALHNFGGVVRGKGKMLAIPLTKEAKRSGGPRRWKGGKLVFRPTRKPRTFLLLGAAGGGSAKKPKAAKKAGTKRGKKPKGIAGKAAAVVASLRKRIATVRKAAGKTMKRAKGKRRTRRGKKNASLLAKLLATLHTVTGRDAKSGGKGGAKDGDSQSGPPLVAQFLLVDEVRIPQREFMGVSEKAWGQITDAVGEAVVRGWMSGPVGGMGLSVG